MSYTTDASDNEKVIQNLHGLEGNIISAELKLETAEDNDDNYKYYLYNKDIQGSTVSILDETGAGELSYEYDDFGETEVYGISSLENEICYTGGIYDETTGLYYLNARYYDPVTGRFLTEDTYRGELGEPDTLHLYVYCKNNPVNYMDPSGHSAITIAAKGISMIFGSASISALAPVVAIAIGVFLAVKGYQKWGSKIKKKVDKIIFKTALKTVVSSTERAEYYKGLAISIARAKVAKKRGKDEKHHIVLQKDSRAKPDQKALKKVNISIHSNANTVMLDYRLHRRVHRKTYINFITSYIPKKPATKSNIYNRLSKIKLTLKAANNAIKAV